MSFCKIEGDEDAINRIEKELENISIKKFFYRGNIEEALDVLYGADIIVGTRFHANVIGMIMQKKVIPIAYSDKTLNVLKDINFKGVYFDIRDSEVIDLNKIAEEKLNYVCNVSNQIEDAELQFKELDNVLERNENSLGS